MASKAPGRRPRYVVDPTPAPGGVWLVAGLALVAALAAVVYGFMLMIEASNLQTGTRDFYTTLGMSLGLLLVGMPLLFASAWAVVDGQRWAWAFLVLGFVALTLYAIYAAIFSKLPFVVGSLVAILGAATVIYLLSGTVRDYFRPEPVHGKASAAKKRAAEDDDFDDE